MLPPLQSDEHRLKAWSWLRGRSLQGHVQCGVECDPMQYENKVGITKEVHSLNLQGENSPEGVQNYPKRITY
jgi:hypothetical protein